MFINLILIGVLALLNNSFGQTEQFYENWRWTHFTTKTGLPSDIVEDVLEADDGTVWVSTAKGIAWYDGFRWNPIIVDSLYPDERVKKIVKKNNENIFVIQNGKLFVGNKNGFNKVDFPNILKSGTIVNVGVIDSLSFMCSFNFLDSSANIIINPSGILYVCMPAPGKLIKSKNNIWNVAAENMGLYRLNKFEWNKVNISNNTNDNSIAVRDIVENSDGEIVIAIDAPKQHIGIWEYLGKGFSLSSSERSQPIRALDISNDGTVIVVFECGEIHIRKKRVWKKLDPVPSRMTNIVSIKYRKNNDIWFATEEGLFLFSRRDVKWKQNNVKFSDFRNIVMEIFKSNNGDIWIGNIDGIEVRQKNGNTFYIREIGGVKLGLVTGINQDENGNIWISSGAEFKGVFEWNGSKWTHHLFKNKLINYHKIRKDKIGRLWFLGLGLKSDDPAGYILQDRKIVQIDSLYKISTNRLYSFSQSINGTIWLGTVNGLVRITNNKIKMWIGKELLGDNTKVYTLTTNNSNMLLFSTFSGLLGTIDGKDSINWIWKSEEIFEYNQKVWDLVCDESGLLWAATTKGLYCYNNSTWTNYSDESGVYLRELRVVLPTEDKIYVGGHGIGVRVMDRRNIRTPLKVFLSKTIVESNIAHCSWTPLSYWGVTPTEQIKTRYRLDNQAWTNWSTQHYVILDNLPSGDHSLIVEAIDAYGFIGESKAETTFYIEPPVLYRPMYAIPFLTLASLVGITTYRIFQNKKEYRKSLNDQRLRIASDLHDEVGSNLGSITLLSQRLVRNSSEDNTNKERLSLIADSAMQTADYIRDFVWCLNPRYDRFVNLETRLREIAGRMLMEMPYEFQVHDELNKDEGIAETRRNILLMFKEILHNIIKHSNAKSVAISLVRKPSVFLLSVRDDGIGFDLQKSVEGNGLQSLKRRAEILKAELFIEAKNGIGTEVVMIFKNDVIT
ncbi:MAG: histidine kinase [Bacteroidota bacterium]